MLPAQRQRKPRVPREVLVKWDTPFHRDVMQQGQIVCLVASWQLFRSPNQRSQAYEHGAQVIFPEALPATSARATADVTEDDNEEA